MARLAERARPEAADEASDPFETSGNVQAFLRALHLTLALSPAHPACRADLLLVLMDALRESNGFRTA